MSNRYAIVEQAIGQIVNAVLWDGQSDWSPGEGLTAVPSDNAEIGGTLIDGVYTAPGT